MYRGVAQLIFSDCYILVQSGHLHILEVSSQKVWIITPPRKIDCLFILVSTVA